MAGSSLAHSRVGAPAPEISSVPARVSPVPDFPLAPIVLSAEAQLQALLPPGHTIERVLVELYNVCQKTPTLMRAKAEQLIPALCDALSLGGVIGRDVYLAPFNNSKANRVDVTMMVDYKFEAELVCLAGGAKSITAENVYSNEPFEYALGSDAFLRHRQLPPSKRGQWIGSYAVADLGPGAKPVIKFLFAEQVEAVRKGSKSWGPRDYPECPEWYGPKTGVHRIVKLLPKKPALRAMLDKITAVDRHEFGGDSDEVGAEIRAAPAPARIAQPATPDAFDGIGDLDDETDERREEPTPLELSLVEASDILYQNRPLGTLRNSQLRKIEDAARAKVDEEGEGSRYVKLLAGCRVVLRARERGVAMEPAAEKTTDPNKPF